MIIFLWIILSIAVAMLATKRGRSGGIWFIIAIVLSPLLGFIFLLVSKDLSRDEGDRVSCPKCSEKVLLTAKICPHCKSNLEHDLAFQSTVSKIKTDKADEPKNLMIGIGFIVALIVIAKIIDTY